MGKAKKQQSTAPAKEMDEDDKLFAQRAVELKGTSPTSTSCPALWVYPEGRKTSLHSETPSPTVFSSRGDIFETPSSTVWLDARVLFFPAAIAN